MSEPTVAEAPASEASAPPSAPRRRRVRLPVILFLLTCVSTFLAGAAQWAPTEPVIRAIYGGDLSELRRLILTGWSDGLVYSVAVLAILMAHEMGHFVATLYYRIPASLPFFLPLPIFPIGTMGAVIGMDGRRADRKQIFDIGIAGPLAGLVIAIPVMWLGVQQLDMTQEALAQMRLDSPLLVRWMMSAARPLGYEPGAEVWLGHLNGNPLYMAGWVGLLITGLNMLPVSQLDGGHVIYTLLGRRSRIVSRLFMLGVAIFILTVPDARPWALMALLVLLIGTDHPPTRDDSVDIGLARKILGWASLSIPILCFPPRGLSV